MSIVFYALIVIVAVCLFGLGVTDDFPEGDGDDD